MHAYMHTSIHTYIHNIHACIHPYITYMHAYMHTYIHTSIHPSIHTYIAMGFLLKSSAGPPLFLKSLPTITIAHQWLLTSNLCRFGSWSASNAWKILFRVKESARAPCRRPRRVMPNLLQEMGKRKILPQSTNWPGFLNLLGFILLSSRGFLRITMTEVSKNGDAY